MIKGLKFPSRQVGFNTMGNPGGQLAIAEGEVKITFVQAIHSNNLDAPDSDKSGVAAFYGGVAVGCVIEIQDGPTIYGSGDTEHFCYMKLVGNKFRPDLAILNIGGHFGMEVPDAIEAAKAIHARLTIPQHYKSFSAKPGTLQRDQQHNLEPPPL